MPTRKVVDASVVAAAVFHEPRDQEALGLLADSDLYAPLLLPWELSNVAWKKARRRPHESAAVLLALQEGLKMSISLVDVDHAGAVRLGLETGLSSYDASYLYLSRIMTAPLVTFDAKLLAILRI